LDELPVAIPETRAVKRDNVVCPVVWEGWHREVSPYPDQRPLSDDVADVIITYVNGKPKILRRRIGPI
jgi:hypothetical protein